MSAGLPLIRRIVLGAARAGFQRVLVHPRACPEPRLLEGSGASMLGADAGAGAPGRLVLLPVNVLPQARWLRLLREMPLDPGTPAVDPSGAATVDGMEGGALLRSAGDGARDLIAELARRRPRVASAGDPAGRFSPAGADGPQAAAAWVVHSLVQDTQGFLSRHVPPRISPAVPPRL